MTTYRPVEPGLEFLFHATVRIAEPISVGPVQGGERRIVPIVGGTFEGPGLKGVILPGGADWQIVRPDGSAALEARYTLETDDGARITVRNTGVRAGPPEVLARIARGESVDPASYYFRATPIFECGSPQYAWLNDLVAVASAVRTREAVLLDFYAVR